MRIKVGDPFAAFDYSNHVKGYHSVEIIYFATFTDPLKQIKLDPDDHSEFGWFAENELDKVTTPEKGQEDPEFKILCKAFALLRGQNLNTG